MYDTVGAGSEEFGLDGRLQNGGWEKGAKGLRRGGQISVLDAFDGAAKIIKPSSQESQEERSKKRRKLSGESEDMVTELPPSNQERNTTRQDDDVSRQEEPETPPKLPPEKQIFRNLCIYINGSTFPLISDHKLKRLLAEHGARLSIALGRRPVTHVVMGTPNSNGSGAGGGLAGGKIQKEIAAVKGCGIKFVSVEWVLESLKAGKRLPETRFGCLKIAAKGQKSVLGMLEKG